MMSSDTTLPTSCHGTAVAFEGQGVLILGPAGSGKSSLALQLMALGAGLIADDLTWVERRGDAIQLNRPPTAPKTAQIEARGFAVLDAAPAPPANLTLIIDMGRTETRRLPDPQMREIGGVAIRAIHKVDNPAFPAMVMQYLLSK